MEQPIACTLSAADHTARADQTTELARRALRSREPIPNGARLRFERSAETERQLRTIIEAEAECCPFLRLDLQPADDALVLEITGPAEADPIIAELFS